MLEQSEFYVVERDFIHAGLQCLVVFNSAGFRTGYVGVDKDHRLFGLDYTDSLDIAVTNSDEDDEVDYKSFDLLSLIQSAIRGEPEPGPTVCSYFDIHGGIDFSDFWPVKESKYAQKALWYFGFACNHISDYIDIDCIKKYFPDTDIAELTMLEEILTNLRQGMHPTIKDANFVENELRKLAEQFQAFHYHFDPNHDPKDVMNYMMFVAPKARHIIETNAGKKPEDIIHPELGKVLFSQAILVHVDEKKKKRKKKKRKENE